MTAWVDALGVTLQLSVPAGLGENAYSFHSAATGWYEYKAKLPLLEENSPGYRDQLLAAGKAYLGNKANSVCSKSSAK